EQKEKCPVDYWRGKLLIRAGAKLSYRKLQVLGRPECDFPACFDLYGLSGCRIAPHAGCAVSNLQDAETDDLNSFALLEMFGDQADEIAEDGFTSPFCYLVLLRQGRCKMLERDGAAGLGRSRWFRAFVCHDGYPPLCAECAYGRRDMIRDWKKRGFWRFAGPNRSVSPPKSGHSAAGLACPLCATSGLTQCSKSCMV